MHTSLRVIGVLSDLLVSVAAEGGAALPPWGWKMRAPGRLGAGPIRRRLAWVGAQTGSVCFGRFRFYYGACEPAA
jgi:hypothetical protein